MKSEYKTKYLLGLTAGLACTAAGLGLWLTKTSPGYVPPLLLLGGVPLYLWGCCVLAEAKGYSTAIVLTAIFGLLFPLVVLLALPDKTQTRQRHRRRRGSRRPKAAEEADRTELAAGVNSASGSDPI